FLQSIQLCCARYWYYPRFLSKQPSKCYLSWCRLLLPGESCEQINQYLVRFPVFVGKSRNSAAKIRRFKICIFVDLSRKKSLTQRTKGNKANSEFFQGRQDFFFRFPIPKGIFTLQSSHRLDCVVPANRLNPCFGKTIVLYLSFSDYIFLRSCYFFNRNVGINPVLVIQVHGLYLQSFP